MKKYLLLSLSVIALSAVSCKKCQTCTTHVTQNVAGISVDLSVEEDEYCGDNYDDAPEDMTIQQNVSGISQTISVTCVDN